MFVTNEMAQPGPIKQYGSGYEVYISISVLIHVLIQYQAFL